MKDSDFFFSTFRFGIASWFGIPLSLALRLKLIRNVGFDFTDVWWEAREGAGSHIEAVHIARELGISVQNAHLPFEDCMEFWNGEEARSGWLSRTQRMLDECVHCSVPVAVLHVTKGREEIFIDAKAAVAMAMLVQHAESVGVQLAIENTRQPHIIEYFLREILC